MKCRRGLAMKILSVRLSDLPDFYTIRKII